jgi:hypothetical protein
MPISLEPPMKNILVLTTVVLSACTTTTPPQSEAQTTKPAQTASSTQTGSRAQASTPPREQAAPGAASATAEISLNDLNVMTFSCAKAGLNAAAREAAREAAKAPAKGIYQFSYFRLVSSSHHSIYEVHFKSNNYEDPDLKYCVSVYCQQGWDPKTANPSVRSMGKAARPTRANAADPDHLTDCGEHQMHIEPRKKR